MVFSRQRLGEILVAQRLITKDQLDGVMAVQREKFQPLGQILIQSGLLTEERLLQVCAMQKGVAAWQLQSAPPDPEVVSLLPEKVCRINMLIPVQIKDGRLLIAMRDTDDIDIIDMVRNITKMRVEPVLASEERIVEAIVNNFGVDDSHSQALHRYVNDAMDEFGSDSGASEVGETVLTETDIRPVVGLVNQIFEDALRMHASDIHIEPRKDRIEIRYRVDGQLIRVHDIPVKLKAPLIARIKVLAHLDIVEYRTPQDGRLNMKFDGKSVDMRVSVLPNYHGQRIVIRLLDKNVALQQLPALGFSEHNLTMYQDMINKPYGLILVTGPTGSGKTTTLYASLNQLRKVSNNIMTCEDPVEYDIDGINQSQMSEKLGLTFSAQLRSILRQDPDIIMVGEIRDKETAETAIRAALTGHLVLSTLHCNDASSAIPRLIDMGIEPFLLSSALIGITAQRLVRILCPHCKTKYKPSEQELLTMGLKKSQAEHIWRPGGCAACMNTGYKGRVAVHEIFPAPQAIQHAIAAHEPMDSVRALAEEYGYQTLQHAAIERVLSGETSLGEVSRVVFFDTSHVPIDKPAGTKEPNILRVA